MTSPLEPRLWALDPGVAHLNHGSYGAVPLPVLEAQLEAARRIECSPERFYRVDLAPAMDAVRAEVAGFLTTDPDGLTLVQNATEAVQVVLEAVALAPGREVVYTDHAYAWVEAAIRRECGRSGAAPRRVELPLDELGAVDLEALIATLQEAVTERAALLVLAQITSASALRVPIDAALASLGNDVPVLVDAAHAPGLIDSPVPARATFWLGNLHKWAFAARTAAALVVAPDYRDRVEPLVASAGSALGYPRSFTYLGTQDPSAFLALPASLQFSREHLGLGFRELRERNVALLEQGLQLLGGRLGLKAGADNGLPLRTVDLGRAGDHQAAVDVATKLRDDGVEVAITSLAGRLHARVSVQAYVGLDDFRRLAEALGRVVD